MRCPVVIQHDDMDCGAACLAMIGKFYGMRMPLIKYRNLLKCDNNGTSMQNIVQAANQIKLNAVSLKGNWKEFVDAVNSKQIKLPCVAVVKMEGYLHYVVVYRIGKRKIKYADPFDGLHTTELEEFASIYADAVITFDQKEDFQKLHYKRKSVDLIGAVIKRNTRILCAIFFLSMFITFLTVGGSMLLEYTVNSVVVETDAHGHDECDDEEAIVERMNHVIENLNVTPLAIMGLLLLVYSIRLAMEMLKSFTVSKVACNIEKDISEGFFDKLIGIPLSVYKERKSGDFITRFNDVKKLNNFLNGILTTFILNITFFLGFGIILFAISKELLACAMLVILLFAAFTLSYQKRIKRKSFDLLKNNAVVVSNVEETIRGIELIKTNNLTDERKTRFGSQNTSYINSLRQFANVRFCHDNIANWIASSGDFFVIGIGIKLYTDGNLELSSLMLFYMLCAYFMNAFSRLVCLVPQFSEMVTVFERVEDVWECENERVSIEQSGLQDISDIEEIKMSGISYQYGLQDFVLQDVSMEIQKGDKIMLLGGNGSGKSTLAHIMVGNYRDFQGEVLYSGKKNVNVASIKNNISYVNQDTFLFHDSIVNNIVMGCEHVTEEKLYEVCVVAGVDEMVREFPEGYNHVICDNGANLSGGQKQKIAMARALLRDTAIYIFDESSSNMDVVSEHNFMRIISEYLAEKTVIVISHNKMFREFANKVYKIEGGRLLSC